MSEENKTAQAPANEPSMATAPTGAPAGTPVQELTVQDLDIAVKNEDVYILTEYELAACVGRPPEGVPINV